MAPIFWMIFTGLMGGLFLTPYAGVAIDQPPAPQTKPVMGNHVGVLGKDHPFVIAMMDAYKTNPSLKAALESHHLSAENVGAAKAGWRPNIGMTGQTGYNVTDDQRRDINQSANPKTAGLSLKQNIFQGGKTVSGVKAAKFDVLSKRAAFNAAEQQVLSDTIGAYLNLWFLEQRLGHVRRSKDFYEQTFTQAKARFEVGELSLTDVSQSEFSYRKSLADEASALTELENGRTAYFTVVGNTAPKHTELPPFVQDLIALPGNINDFLALAEHANPEISAANFSYQQARENINSAYGTFSPTVDVQGNATRSLQGSDRRDRQNSLSATVQLTIPLFQQGTEWSTLRGSYHTANQQKYKKVQIRNKVLNDATTAWNQYHTALSQIQFYEAQVAAGAVRIEGTREQMLVGELTLLDVLNAESDVTQARIDLDKAKLLAQTTGYQILFFIGQLTSTCLQLPVATYNTIDYAKDAEDRLFGFGTTDLK